MANINRGEVGFTGLDGKKYTLSFSTNALCALDDALDVKDFFKTVLPTGNTTLKQYRTMFFIALRDRGRHTEIEDENAACDLVIYGDMMELLTKTIQAQTPKISAEANGSEATASPQLPGQQPTGPASSANGSALAS